MIRFLSTIATVVLVAVLTIREVRGQSEEVEWKFYGGGSPNEQRKERHFVSTMLAPSRGKPTAIYGFGPNASPTLH